MAKSCTPCLPNLENSHASFVLTNPGLARGISPGPSAYPLKAAWHISHLCPSCCGSLCGPAEILIPLFRAGPQNTTLSKRYHPQESLLFLHVFSLGGRFWTYLADDYKTTQQLLATMILCKTAAQNLYGLLCAFVDDAWLAWLTWVPLAWAHSCVWGQRPLFDLVGFSEYIS